MEELSIHEMYHVQLCRIDVFYSIVNNECSRRDKCDASQLRMIKILKKLKTISNDFVSLFPYN